VSAMRWSFLLQIRELLERDRELLERERGVTRVTACDVKGEMLARTVTSSVTE